VGNKQRTLKIIQKETFGPAGTSDLPHLGGCCPLCGLEGDFGRCSSTANSSRPQLQIKGISIPPSLSNLNSGGFWSYNHLQKYTAPGQKQPIRVRRNVLAVSTTLV
ncbi:hypothetical protein GOODEAATRI_021351, partial [Goodea atripinnis]